MGTVRAAWSDASWGDLRPSGPTGGVRSDPLERWVAQVTGSAAGAPSTVHQVHWVDQVHGARVIRVPEPGDGRPRGDRGTQAVTAVFSGTGDVLVSDAPAHSLCMLTADCAPVALGSGEGVFAAVHAGWRGLQDGVVEAAVAAMRTMGATRVVGALGPCIHPGCYEFAEDHLEDLTAHFGELVRGRTSAARPALDIPAVVAAALAAAGAERAPGVDACTACAGGYFSHRARQDGGRQALVVWSAPP